MKPHFFSVMLSVLAFTALSMPVHGQSQNQSDSQGAAQGNTPLTNDAGASGNQALGSIEGDAIVLKNGKVLRGVKVAKITPNMLELEYIPGEATMKVPRKQVAEIQYGSKGGAVGAESQTIDGTVPDVMLGEELSAEFHRKITTPVSDTAVEFKDMDCLEILKELAERMGAEVVFDESVTNIPETERHVTVTLPAGTPLSTFFRREFRESVPSVKVAYEYEKIHVLAAGAPSTPPPPRNTPNQ